MDCFDINAIGGAVKIEHPYSPSPSSSLVLLPEGILPPTVPSHMSMYSPSSTCSSSSSSSSSFAIAAAAAAALALQHSPSNGYHSWQPSTVSSNIGASSSTPASSIHMPAASSSTSSTPSGSNNNASLNIAWLHAFAALQNMQMNAAYAALTSPLSSASSTSSSSSSGSGGVKAFPSHHHQVLPPSPKIQSSCNSGSYMFMSLPSAPVGSVIANSSSSQPFSTSMSSISPLRTSRSISSLLDIDGQVDGCPLSSPNWM
jgi:hypothetical protein